MKRILLVKTSSLGDVVHNLPAASDIRRHFPRAGLDWALEESYAPLARMHPGIDRVIPVAVRRWRSRLLAANTWRELRELRASLRLERYDVVIDTQGLLKSALIAGAARGRRHGFDAASLREPLAARFYDVVHRVGRSLHAVERNRLLAAAALGYRVSEGPDYGLGTAPPGRQAVPEAFFLHSTSRPDKHWSESEWIALGRMLGERGVRAVLPWGDEAGRGRSERIAAAIPLARIPPALSLAEMARQLGGAAAAVGVDTGLTHLAVALGLPVVAVYCSTEPGLTGTYGSSRARNLGGPGHAPAAAQVLDVLRTWGLA